jgi:hypothetical protein
MVLTAVAAFMFAVPAQAAGSTGAVARTITVHQAGNSMTRTTLLVAPNVANPCLGKHLVCLFQNYNASGAIDAFTPDFLLREYTWNLTDDQCPSCTNGVHGNDGTWNDQMSSWGNDSGNTFCWWVDINRQGAGHLIYSFGAGIQNVYPSENDTASSVGVADYTCH